MIATLTSVALLLLSVAMLWMGNGLQGTIVPLRASIDGFSAIEIGILGSFYYIGFIAGCLYGPYVVRRTGHIRTFALMVAASSAIVLCHLLIAEPLVWWLLRAGSGFCIAALFTVAESWLNEKANDQNRGQVFSFYATIHLTVITIGQLMLTLGSVEDFRLFVLASILISLATVPVALTKAEAPAPITSVTVRIRHLYRLSPVGIVGCLAVGLANGTFWSLGPIYAMGDSVDTNSIAIFMGLVVMAGAIGQWPMGWLSDRTDRRKVIAMTCIGATLAGLGMVMFAIPGSGANLFFAFFYGMFSLPLYALCVAHMNDFVDPRSYVETASGLLLVFAIGAVIGPFFASFVIRNFGNGNLFAFTACVHLATAAFAVYRMRIRAPAASEEHIAFADALMVAETVSTVDPLSTAAEADQATPTGY